MSYRTEVPIGVLLHRQWSAPGPVVAKVCEYLPEAFKGSYFNTAWSFHTTCSEGALADSAYILQAGLWLRYPGSVWDDPDTAIVAESTLTAMLRNALIVKSTRLAIAVVAVGYNPTKIDADIIDSNLELFRFLCQGPWPWPGPIQYHLDFQLAYCFRLLVVEAREDRDRTAARDLWMMEAVFAKAFDVLDLGVWRYEDHREFFGEPTGAPRLGNLFRPAPTP
jgi:hypothetical protein